MKTRIYIHTKDMRQTFSGKDYADIRYKAPEEYMDTYQYEAITSDNTALVRCHSDAHTAIINRFNEIDDLMDWDRQNLYWDHNKNVIQALIQVYDIDYYIGLDTYADMEYKIESLLYESLN